MTYSDDILFKKRTNKQTNKEVVFKEKNII